MSCPRPAPRRLRRRGPSLPRWSQSSRSKEGLVPSGVTRVRFDPCLLDLPVRSSLLSDPFPGLSLSHTKLGSFCRRYRYELETRLCTIYYLDPFHCPELTVRFHDPETGDPVPLVGCRTPSLERVVNKDMSGTRFLPKSVNIYQPFFSFLFIIKHCVFLTYFKCKITDIYFAITLCPCG